MQELDWETQPPLAPLTKEWVEVELTATQRPLFDEAVEGVRQAVEGFKASIPKGTTVTLSGPDGRGSTIEGEGEARE